MSKQEAFDPNNIHLATTQDGIELRIINGNKFGLVVGGELVSMPFQELHALIKADQEAKK